MNRANQFVGSVSVFHMADGTAPVQPECNWLERTLRIGDCVTNKQAEAAAQTTQSTTENSFVMPILGAPTTFEHKPLTDYNTNGIGIQINPSLPELSAQEPVKEIEIKDPKTGQKILLAIVLVGMVVAGFYLIKNRNK